MISTVILRWLAREGFWAQAPIHFGAKCLSNLRKFSRVRVGIMIAHNPSTDPDKRDSRIRVGIERRRCIGGQRGVAVTGSSSEHAGASFRASISFLRPPVSSRTAGLPRSGWGQQLSPWSLPMMTSHVKRWPASFGYHQVCSKARRARLHRHAPATVCRQVCVPRPT